MEINAQGSEKSHFETIFNIGVKASNVEEEIKFLSAFNPDKSYKVKFGPKEIDAVDIGGVRFFVFNSLSYDSYLPQPHPGGLAHVSFMIDDLDALLADLEGAGIKPFRGPYEGQLGELGSRMVAMFRSPNGTLVSAIPRK